jgi:imidazolonepropionase-like amidohydrolase
MTSGKARSTVFLAGTLIDGTGREPISPAAVVVDEGRITQVGRRSEIAYSTEDSQVIDVSQRVLIPGLIDSHCHVFYFGHHFQERSLVAVIARAITNAGIWLDKGVTTARDVGTRENLDIGLRDAIQAGLVRGPRLFVSGTALAMTGAKQEELREVVIEVTGADEARLVTRMQLRAGVDLIKIFSTAGLTEGGVAQLTIEEMRAIVEEAHKVGRKVACHAIATDGIKNALRAGVDTIEHGTFLDDEAIEMMVAGGAVLVPTLSIGKTTAERGLESGRPLALVENARRSLESRRTGARKAYEAGVRIAAGTDPVSDDTMAMECKALLEVGLSPMDVISAATRIGAEILGLQDKIGTIEVGKQADIIVLDGNPLEDITALERVDYVVKDGLIVKAPGQTPAIAR